MAGIKGGEESIVIADNVGRAAMHWMCTNSLVMVELVQIVATIMGTI